MNHFELLEKKRIALQEQNELKQFTTEELAQNDGRAGRPAYVSVNGNVYDVTDKDVWSDGIHFGLLAGTDVSSGFASCHVGQTDIIENLPLVGVMVE